MKTYTAYRLDTGEVLHTGAGKELPPLADGVGYLEGMIDMQPGYVYRVVDGQVKRSTPTYTAYRIDTGEIVQCGAGLTRPEFPDGIAVIDGHVEFRAGYQYRVVDGRVVETPIPVEIRELRQREYPGVGDQLDALWKLADALLRLLPPDDPRLAADALAVREAILAVKARHPKDTPK